MTQRPEKAEAVTVDEGAHVVFRALVRVSGLVHRVMYPWFVHWGISSGAQWGVMQALRRAERQGQGGLRLSELGDRLLVRPPSVTGVIDRLERSGLVRRSADNADLRAKQVSLTAAGRALLDGSTRGHAARVRKLMEALSPAEQADLARLLQKLGRHMAAVADKEPPAPEI
jgi:DNA-binding MarR family transcriptional regulator